MGEIEVTHYIKGTVYLTILIATIHYNKRSVVDLRRVLCLFEESYYSPAPLKVSIYSKELVAISFVCTNPILS